MNPSPARAWRIVALTVLAVWTAACTSMRVLPGRVPQPLPVTSRDDVRLILGDGRAVYLREVRIVGDSIVGMNSRANSVETQRYAIPTADVVEMAVRRGDAFKTVLLVASGLVLLTTVFLFAIVLTLASGT